MGARSSSSSLREADLSFPLLFFSLLYLRLEDGRDGAGDASFGFLLRSLGGQVLGGGCSWPATRPSALARPCLVHMFLVWAALLRGADLDWSEAGLRSVRHCHNSKPLP